MHVHTSQLPPVPSGPLMHMHSLLQIIHDPTWSKLVPESISIIPPLFPQGNALYPWLPPLSLPSSPSSFLQNSLGRICWKWQDTTSHPNCFEETFEQTLVVTEWSCSNQNRITVTAIPIAVIALSQQQCRRRCPHLSSYQLSSSQLLPFPFTPFPFYFRFQESTGKARN